VLPRLSIRPPLPSESYTIFRSQMPVDVSA
jgi:hypothetical protein